MQRCPFEVFASLKSAGSLRGIFASLKSAGSFMPFRFVVAVALLAGLSPGQSFQTLEDPSSLLQQPTRDPNAKRYTVTGTVVNSVTSEPINRALVRLNGQEARIAFTGPDGRFEFQNVVEGNVWITAQRPGFSSVNPRANGTKVGSGSNDFRVLLIPETHVTGTVQDSEGNPLEGVGVRLLRAQIMDGHKQWVPAGGTETDDNGEYKVTNDQPGEVMVCVSGGELARIRLHEVHTPRCYPNAPDLASAQPIAVAAGQSAQADFTIETVPAYRVSGTVLGGGRNVWGWVMDPTGMPGIGAGVDPRTHRFTMGPLPNGVWKIRFQSNGDNGNNNQFEQEVSINGADVTNLQVTLAPGARIPVEFIQPATNSQQPSVQGTPSVRLYEPGSTVFNSVTLVAMPDPDAAAGTPRQIVKDVPPGNYRVAVQSAGGCIGSVVSGGLDLLQQPLTVSAGAVPQPIVVTQTNACASLEITLHSDHPEDQATLLLVPELAGLEARVLGVTGNSFTFSDVTPGTYHVYAVNDANDLEYANPEAMRDMGGQTVTLEANQKATVSLTVIERKQ